MPLQLPPDVQIDADAVLAAWRGGIWDGAAMKRVTDWLDRKSGYSPSSDFDESCQALPPWSAQDVFSEVDDDDVAFTLGLDDGVDVTDEDRLTYFRERRLPALFEDADAVSGFASIGIRASDGTSAVLVHEIHGYSFSEVTVEFAGLYGSFEDFRQSLVSDGWIMGVDEFSELPEEEQKRMLGLAP
jgi:hypothetical protein